MQRKHLSVYKLKQSKLQHCNAMTLLFINLHRIYMMADLKISDVFRKFNCTELPQDSYNPTENNSATDILNSYSRCDAIPKQYPIFVPTVYQPPEDIEDHHLLNNVNVLSPIDFSSIQSCSTTTPLGTNFSIVCKPGTTHLVIQQVKRIL